VALRIEASSSSRYTAAASLSIATMFISLIICGCGREFGWCYVVFAITFSTHRARDRTVTRTDSDTLKNRMRTPKWSRLIVRCVFVNQPDGRTTGRNVRHATIVVVIQHHWA